MKYLGASALAFALGRVLMAAAKVPERPRIGPGHRSHFSRRDERRRHNSMTYTPNGEREVARRLRQAAKREARRS